MYYYKHKKKEMEAQVKTIVDAGDRTLEQAESEREEMVPTRRRRWHSSQLAAPESTLGCLVDFHVC